MNSIEIFTTQDFLANHKADLYAVEMTSFEQGALDLVFDDLQWVKHIFLATHENDIVGYAAISHKPALDKYTLDQVLVFSQYHRQGHGAAILQKIYDHVVEEDKLPLHCVVTTTAFAELLPKAMTKYPGWEQNVSIE